MSVSTPPGDPPAPAAATASIFISHVEEDRATMEELARGLHEHGFAAWAYETDTLPGPTYLAQVVQAIEGASAVILVISPEALGSHQVAKEIEVAHDLDRPIIPVLKGVTHERLQKRRPDWRLALGGSTSVAIPEQGVPAIVPRIVAGLGALGITPDATPPPVAAGAAAGPPQAPRRALTRLRPLVLAGVALALLVTVLVVVLLAGGGERQGTGPSAAQPEAPAEQPAPTAGGFAGVDGTLRVDPSSITAGAVARITYSITNGSGNAVDTATTEISIVVGQGLTSSNIVIGGVDKGIPAGKTVKGSLTSDLAGVDLGRQKVLLTIGRKIRGGVVDNRVLAEEPITVKG